MRWMILAATLTFAVSTTGQAAQIYKWVDAQGVTHFDAQPPAGETVQQIDVQKPVPAPAPAKPVAPVKTDVSKDQQSADAKVKKQIAAQEAQRIEYCSAQRTNLAQLQNNPRVREKVNGELKKFTDEDRKNRIAEVKKAIGDTCD
jgi:hypothetical protein